MTKGAADSVSSFLLAQLLAKKPSWTLKTRLTLIRRLAHQVQVLHQKGLIHRAIAADAVTVSRAAGPQLAVPPPEPRRFGGEQCDPEFCPPELAQGPAVDLPVERPAAAAILRDRAATLDPRRIDIYQLGVLLCQVLTGEPFLNYLYSAAGKAKVPAVARPLLESCLGENSGGLYVDCDSLLAALDDLIRQMPDKPPAAAAETPHTGSVMVNPGDTACHGKPVLPPPRAREEQKLPFERLGHFRIADKIGAGGMGDVYRGYDESLDRYVAIKVLPAELARDADFVRRFRAEAAAVAKVTHPNVVPIHFIGQDAGHEFFAMQFVDGESLAQRLAEKKRLPPAEALAIVKQCLSGLEAAHGQGLVHRDIKPSNVLLEKASDRAVLVDFGLARRMDGGPQHTATGVVMGTVDYIAPEQARGHAVDGRTDIYSLGVMFYQLLSGRLPFVADSPTAMVFQHAYEPPFPLRQAAPDVPPGLAAIVARMMAKEPEERYPTCAAALADIASYEQTVLPSPFGRGVGGEGSDDLLLSRESPWQQARDWAATMFRRHAPEFVQQLQGTTQQMDAAVAHYERRCRRLAALLQEAQGVGDASAEPHVADLQRQLNEADATLAQLRSQQNLLKARLKTAEAQRDFDAPLPRKRPWRWLIVLAVVGVAVMALVLHPPITDIKVPPPAPPVAKKMDFVIGPKFFQPGDSVTIDEVWSETGSLAKGDTVFVKGRYTLASHPAASLCFFVTPATGEPPDHSAGLVWPIERGSAPFEMKRHISCNGHLHIGFYDEKGSFGNTYFGTPAQMREIADLNIANWDSAATDNAAVPVTAKIVTEGLGWGGFRLGASLAELIKSFGLPDENSQQGKWISWESRHHVGCLVDGSRGAYEIRFSAGFNLPLSSGIRIGSAESDVFAAYGAPDRIVEQPQSKMLRYGSRGVLMWIADGRVFNFTVFRAKAESNGALASNAKTRDFPQDAKLNAEQRQFRDSTERQFQSFLVQTWVDSLGPEQKAVLEARLVEQLSGDDKNARMSAINTLAALGSKRAVPGLLHIAAERLQKDNSERWMAIRALGFIGEPSVVPELVHLTYYYNTNVRMWAQISLVRLTGENFADNVAAWQHWWQGQGGQPPISAEKVEWKSPGGNSLGRPSGASSLQRQTVAAGVPPTISGMLLTIPALSNNGVSLGPIRRNTAIRIQYVQGNWKAWGHVATVSPDAGASEGGDRSRLVIANAPDKAGPGTLLQIVPAGTAQKAFLWRADRDYENVILRINDCSTPDRPGAVQYRVQIEPMDKVSPPKSDTIDSTVWGWLKSAVEKLPQSTGQPSVGHK